MFRTIQKLESSVKLEPHFKVHQIGEDGIAELVEVPAVGEFPPMESFQLDKMIKAGVPIKQVNTKVLGNTDAIVDAIGKVLEPKSKTKIESKED